MTNSARCWTGFAALWLCGVVAGLGWLADYSNRPGGSGTAPASWPDGSAIEREPGAATLVMVVHPRCSCSRASVGELAEIVARCESTPTTIVLFVRPAGAAEGWERTELWREAGRIRGASLRCDVGGAEARRFGATTSGHALLYAEDGRLLFSGGVTSSRGHPGESAGRAALLALLRHAAPAATETPVYGCDLFDHDPGAELDATCDECRHDPR